MSGFFWALLTACIWGVVPLMEKVGLRTVSPTLGVMVRSLGVIVGLVLFSAMGFPWTTVSTVGWRSIALLAGGGLLASFVGQMVFYHALKSGAISQVTPVAGAYPLVAALLGWCVLREPLTFSRGLGAAFVVLGVILLRK